MMNFISKSFFQGLRPLLPVAITVSLIYWLGALVESLLGRWIKLLLPDSFHWIYWKGAGVAVSLLLVLVLGILFYLPPVRALFAGFEKILETVPGVRGIYSPCRDLVHFFLESGEHRKKRFSKVVMVTLAEGKLKLLGLVTQENPALMPEGSDPKKGEVFVYLPMSYQLGGYTVMVPASAVEPVEMSAEEALRFAMMGGLSRSS